MPGPDIEPNIVALRHKIKSVASSLKWYIDDTKVQMERMGTSLQDARDRLAKLEGQLGYIREDHTGRHKAVDKPPKKKNEAIETLKVIGPWILATLALISALVSTLLPR